MKNEFKIMIKGSSMGVGKVELVGTPSHLLAGISTLIETVAEQIETDPVELAQDIADTIKEVNEDEDMESMSIEDIMRKIFEGGLH